MQQHRIIHILSYLLILLTITTLACSALPSSLAQQEVTPRPTRVPLPTFTPTPLIESLISIPPTPTHTPVPPPTEPPPPTQPPPAEETAPTNTPEPPPTDTPEPPPPPPPAPAEPAPPAEPPPPAEPSADAHGVIGKITFRDGRNTYAVGDKVYANIEATNTAPGLLPFGILGLTTSTGTFQTSWSDGSIASGDTFRHEDGLAFSTPGTHKLYLSICYSSLQECQSGSSDWTQFEPGLDVIIQ